MTKTNKQPLTDAEAEALADRFEAMGPEDFDQRFISEPVARFEAALDAQRRADDQMLEAVAGLRADGLSWVTIGQLLDITGEGARKRYGDRIPELAPDEEIAERAEKLRRAARAS